MRREEIITNLPKFTGGEPPVPPALATAEEQNQATKAKKESSRQYGSKGEAYFRRVFMSLTGSSFDPKHSDAQYQGGYYRQTGVDYSGVVRLSIAETPIRFVAEVKTFQGNFSLSGLSTRQRKYLTKKRREGILAMVILVERKGWDILRMWFVPWRSPGAPKGAFLKGADWGDLLEGLAKKAETDKRFKAKSFRQKDHDLLESNLVEKVKGRWQLCQWLKPLVTEGQPPLF